MKLARSGQGMRSDAGRRRASDRGRVQGTPSVNRSGATTVYGS